MPRPWGLRGCILTDLPAGGDPAVESAVQRSATGSHSSHCAHDSAERLAQAVEGAQGFVYLVARLGVTGATAALSTGLAESVSAVRAATPLPVAVGFGISTPEQARAVAGWLTV